MALKDISFHLDLDPQPAGVAGGVRGPGGLEAVTTAEEAARWFLESRVLESVPSVRGIAGNELAPEEGFEHALTTSIQPPGAKEPSQFVCFQQTHKKVPIFGARPIVELEGKVPLGVSGRASDQPTGTATPTLSEDQAVAAAAQGGTPKAESVQLVFYPADDGAWHLAYHVRGICIPRSITSSAHGPGGSPREDSQLRDVLVDAHDGKVLLEYSAVPLVGIEPTWTSGLDEDDVARDFYTKLRPDGTYEMRDGLNATVTFDAAEADIQAPRPADPVRAAGGDWKDLQRAAVSAHHNAIIVLDFFRSKLKRAGLDNKNSELVSIVRSTYQKHDKPPTWRNAVWWQGAMWYGQSFEEKRARFVSFATRLEIAAHEMTHGLIENTAKLIYLKEHGALNESFSDIFGVIISNSARVAPDSTKDWSWIIGAGIGAGGKDIRDLENPDRLGYPGHYDHYDNTPADSGGVHINSNIHNRAAYNLLKAEDGAGPIFRPDVVALLYYLTLLRLGPTSNFRDALRALQHAAATLYKTKGAQRSLDAIRKAYGDVGITV